MADLTTARAIQKVERLRAEKEIWGYLLERLDTDLGGDTPQVTLPGVHNTHVKEAIVQVEERLDLVNKELKEVLNGTARR